MTRQTSLEAYQAVIADGTIGRQQQRIYRTLYYHGPLTATECLDRIDKELKAHGTKGVNWNTRTRFGELRDRGVLAEVGTRECSITGHRVIVWDVTALLPQPPPKKVKKPSEAALHAAAAELREIYKFLAQHGHPGFSENLVNVCKWMAQ